MPTGFIAKSGIEKIRQKLVDNKMLKGAVNMPPNIFTTGTKVSILFIDKANKEEVVLMMLQDWVKLLKKEKIKKHF